MFDSQILDTAIGLVFVYFFLSLLCSVIVEAITGLTKKRARMLRDGIQSLLQDPKALAKLYKQPFFMGNTTPKNVVSSLWDSLWLPSKKERVPSYISSRSFVVSLLESLKQHPDVIRGLLKDEFSFPDNEGQIREFGDKLRSIPDGSSIKTALLPLLESNAPGEAFEAVKEWYKKATEAPKSVKEKDGSTTLQATEESRTLEGILKEIRIPNIGNFEDVRKLVNSLPDDNTIKRTLLPLLDSAGRSLDKAIDNMEKWYDEGMDRVTGWYKRYSQVFTLILAFIVALALNADTFEMGKAIYRGKALRDSLIAMAGEQAKHPPSSVSAGTQESKKEKQDGAKTPASLDSKKLEKGKAPAREAAGQTGGAVSAPQKNKPVSKETDQDKKEQEKGLQTENGPASKETDLGEKAEKLAKDFKQISAMNLPMGWPLSMQGWPDMQQVLGYHEYKCVKDEMGKEHCEYLCVKDKEGKEPCGWVIFGRALVKGFGILLTALMVSLGSNFWFELLNKLLNMRNAGKKPPTKEEQKSQNK